MARPQAPGGATAEAMGDALPVCAAWKDKSHAGSTTWVYLCILPGKERRPK
jgi:hypothetical protein